MNRSMVAATMMMLTPLASPAADLSKPEIAAEKKVEQGAKPVDHRAACLLQGGKNLEERGDTKRALENYRRLIDQFGDTPAAKKAAERIKALTGK